MANPLLERYSKKKHGTKSEKRIAKSLGARLTPASGALQGAKGDSATPKFLIESKSTIRDSLRLELAWLVKIEKEALNHGKVPLLTISFVYLNGLPKESDWVCVPKWAFDEYFP